MSATQNVGGFTPDAYAEFTRPNDTTAYAAGDHITDTTTASSVVPLRFPAIRTDNGSGVFTGARLIKSTDTTTNASFRLWLFAAQPFAAAGYPADNAAITFTYASMARFLGYIDFTTFIDAGSMAVAEGLMGRSVAPFSKRYVNDSSNPAVDASSTSGILPVPASKLIYGMLEARAAYAPGAQEQFRIWVDVQSD